MKKTYTDPKVEVVTISSQDTMIIGSILGGDTTTQLGKERNNGFEDEEEPTW